MNVAIVGNGILGLQTAYRLIRTDPTVRVTLIGPVDRPGSASKAAAAMLHAFCEVDTATLTHAPERRKFLFNKTANRLWPGVLKELSAAAERPIPHGFGTFLINNHATDPQEDRNFEMVLATVREFDEPVQTVQPSDIPHYKPAASRINRAIYLPREGWVHPVALLDALDEALRRSGRVHVVNEACERLIVTAGRIAAVELTSKDRVIADHVVLCPGANFSRIVEKSDLGIPFMPVFYGIGATLRLKTGAETLTHCVRTPNRGLAGGVYGVPQEAGHTLIGASSLIAPEPEYNPRLTSIHALIKAATEQINENFGHSELVQVNVGWRPTSADLLPLIGPTSISNLLVATGTKRDGLHASPMISQALTDLLLRGTTSYDLSLFNPERPRTSEIPAELLPLQRAGHWR